jgi:hypothetical protein
MPTSPLIQIEGMTPAGAACALVLERAGVRHRITGSEVNSGRFALVSLPVMDELGIAGALPSQRIDRVIERALTEDGALETTAPVGNLVAIQVTELMTTLLDLAESGGGSPADEPALLVDATEFQLGDAELLDDEFLALPGLEQVVHLEWDSGLSEGTRWIRMTGDVLQEVRARADLIATSDRTALILTVPTAALVETSIALPDVMSRLLSHPSVVAEVPTEVPVSAFTRLLKVDGAAHASLGGGLRLRVGAAAGLADSVLLDRELRSGMVAGVEISNALSEGRLGLARLSRIRHRWSALDAESVT